MRLRPSRAAVAACRVALLASAVALLPASAGPRRGCRHADHLQQPGRRPRRGAGRRLREEDRHQDRRSANGGRAGPRPPDHRRGRPHPGRHLLRRIFDGPRHPQPTSRCSRPLAKDVTDKIPAQYSGAHGDWVGVTARSFVLLYNRKLIAEDKLPASDPRPRQARMEGQVRLQPARRGLPRARRRGREGRRAPTPPRPGSPASTTTARPIPRTPPWCWPSTRGEVELAINADNYWQAVAKERGADALDARVHYIGGKRPRRPADRVGPRHPERRAPQGRGREVCRLRGERRGPDDPRRSGRRRARCTRASCPPWP